MNILYYDCFSGISGDMHLGALIDLGVDANYLLRELSKLKLEDEYELVIKKGMKKGISGTKVDVVLKGHHHEPLGPDHHHEPTDTDHHHHEHTNTHHHHHSHEHTHVHRNLKDIEKIIHGSDLSDKVKKMSMDIFMEVAKAEAHVHGKPLYEVHFHEVGAIDSIIDIVGAALAIDYLKVDKIMASPVEVGGGFVKCAHGLIPVPAPATVQILKGIPIKSGKVLFETTTPTGAAILAASVEDFTDQIDMNIEKIGYGIGNRDLEIPNVLRVYLGSENTNLQKKTQYLLETNIDDMNPELYDYITEKLFGAGALDVFMTPIIMKKGRPAIKLSILVKDTDEDNVLEVIFQETTSLGVRKYDVEKIMLSRDYQRIETIYGEVTIKNAYFNGKKVKSKPEYEDCKRLAKENDVSINDIYRSVHSIVDAGEI